MMIGGGGSSCSRADHGIGITETDAGSFVEGSQIEYDFGYDASTCRHPSISVLFIKPVDPLIAKSSGTYPADYF